MSTRSCEICGNHLPNSSYGWVCEDCYANKRGWYIPPSGKIKYGLMQTNRHPSIPMSQLRYDGSPVDY